jgi:putative ABC transport system permease protein
MTQPPVAPSWTSLLWLLAPLGAGVAILAARRLGQAGALAYAAARMAAQLLLLGLVLRWAFDNSSPALVASVGLLMLLASAQTVSGRQRSASWTLRLEVLASLAASVVLVLAVALRLALGLHPWHRADVVIPLLGMLLGNSVNGVSLAAERFERELRDDTHRVERLLALGATGRQAAHHALRAATRAALTPTVNGMLIAGIVAIPGMMTGGLLAGADVAVALRFQVLIYLGIAAVVTLSTLALLELRLRHAFTRDHLLRRLDTPPR